MGVWDPGHGHEIVLRQACASSDASHAIGPITYCGTQSHTHTTRHFHYGANGCHAVADAHPKYPTRYTGPNACREYANDLVDAISKAGRNSTGTVPNLPTQPAGCGDASLSEMLGRVRVFGADAARVLENVFRKAMEYQGESTENQGQMFDGLDELWEEIAELWDEVPNPAKAAALGVACFFLIPAEEATSLTPAGTAVAAVQVATCSAALTLVSEIISDSGDDGGSDSDDSDSGTGSDSTGTDQDSDGGTGGTGTDQESGDGDKVTPDDVADALNRGEDVTDLLNEMYCQQGDPRYAGHC